MFVCRTGGAAANMQADMEMFASASGAAFRVYCFDRDCITAGYSQILPDEICLDKACDFNVEIARRPTGGGLVLHSSRDVIFSCVLPAALFAGGAKSAYGFVSGIVLSAVRLCGIKAAAAGSDGHKTAASARGLCFSGSRDFEIVFGGRKLVGLAQKRTRDKILQQGAICVSRPGKDLFGLLKNPDPGYGPAFLEEISAEADISEKLVALLKGELSSSFENLSSSVV